MYEEIEKRPGTDNCLNHDSALLCHDKLERLLLAGSSRSDPDSGGLVFQKIECPLP